MSRRRSTDGGNSSPFREQEINNEGRVSDQRRRRSTRHHSRRKQSRKPGYTLPQEQDSPYIHRDQTSNDVLNQHYSGEPPELSNRHERRSDDLGDVRYESSNNATQGFDDHISYESDSEASSRTESPMQPTYGPLPSAHVTFGKRIRTERYSHHVDLDSTFSEKPSSVSATTAVEEGQGLWTRAARVIPTGRIPKLETFLKLELSRKADQYRSRPFKYTTATQTDTAFALMLLKEYHGLKTDHVGLVQKITAYKRIAFIHFVQYRAERQTGYAYGRWTIRKRVPVIDHKDDKFRSFFMYQMASKVRKRSKVFNTSQGVPPAAAPTYNWVNRLDELVVPGAVIDIQVEETFDTPKVYLAFLVAILLSLGVALVYGFTMDRDFSTGFAIASWLITVYAFFGAIVAAGEFFGLEKPTATLTPVENIKIGFERSKSRDK